MSCKVKVADNGKYIIGKFEGLFNLKIVRESANKYIKVINSTGIKLILNDVRETIDKMHFSEIFDFANKEIEKIGFPRNIKAAILTSEKDQSQKFHETVANNAGYYVKTFSSYDKAVEWLLV